MEPKQLQAKQSLQWIKKGYTIFMKAPLLWIVLLVICFVAGGALSIVPFIGEPLVSLLMPVMVIGFMAGCRSLEQGDELELAHLFIGFAHYPSRLIALGGIALLGQYLIYGIMILFGGAKLVGVLINNQAPTAPDMMQQAIAGAGASLMIGFVLFSLLMMSMQFAPMLVFFRSVPPLHAMKLSLRAFTRNMSAMLVYGLIFMSLALVASIPMMLGWLVLLPMMFTSLYASFCDIFPAEVTPVDEAGIKHDDQ